MTMTMARSSPDNAITDTTKALQIKISSTGFAIVKPFVLMAISASNADAKTASVSTQLRLPPMVMTALRHESWSSQLWYANIQDVATTSTNKSNQSLSRASSERRDWFSGAATSWVIVFSSYDGETLLC